MATGEMKWIWSKTKAGEDGHDDDEKGEGE